MPRPGLLLALSLLLIPGCTTLQEFANLRNVDFDIQAVNQTYLAGIPMDDVRSESQLMTPMNGVRLANAIRTGELPLRFNLVLGAENPEANGVNARLLQFDWTLLLEGRETVSGVFNDPQVLAPGVTTRIPVGIELDLVRFFGDNLSDLADVALSVAGVGGRSREVALRIVPTVETPIGPIRYPEAITVVRAEVGR